LNEVNGQEIQMPDTVYESGGVRILECAGDGPLLRGDRDAADLISQAASVHADMIVVPVSRFDPGFLSLKTRLAGEFCRNS